ncbi:hypothetical protein ScalyP_jg6820 [Parmales sp. scaly parma]|nr:hypothetical protein ScalyP_jg6820 [Parmales sp. scaly parma]|tara:strand:- start:115 stop:468 length:354 start_codon:yes stop_codon:yes gene_type:complete
MSYSSNDSEQMNLLIGMVIVGVVIMSCVLMKHQQHRDGYEKYCGPLSLCIGCCVPLGYCVCFCPIDERPCGNTTTIIYAPPQYAPPAQQYMHPQQPVMQQEYVEQPQMAKNNDIQYV